MNHKSSAVKIITLIIVLFLAGNVKSFGQEYKAIAVSGNCEIQKGKGPWVKLNAGDKIKSADKIRINKDSYAGLLDNSGKSIELKTQGVFTKTDLAGLSSGRKNVLQKFAGYLLSESVVQKKSDNMKTLGAVVRGAGEKIDLYFPLSTALFDKEIELKWFSSEPGQMYLVKLLNQEGTFLSIYETKDTSLVISLDKFGLLKGRIYRIVVSNSKREEISSDTALFSIAPAKTETEFTDLISKSSLEELSALDKVIKFKWLSANNLNYNALLEYDRLTDTDKNNELIKTSYKEFFLSMGIRGKFPN